MAEADIIGKLSEITDSAQSDLKTPAQVEVVAGLPAKIGDLPIETTKDGKHRWLKLEDASVVLTDLKSSTAISYSKRDTVGARMYQAATGGSSQIIQQFSPGYVAIQGDGLFGVFTGEVHLERAMCAAVSLNGFGTKLKKMLADEFGDDVPEMKDSGLKVGADTGTMLVRRIGVRGDHNEPVWAGKPVNYAAKCAQAAKAGQVIVTARFFKPFRDNEYVRYSCGHQAGEFTGEVGPLWWKVDVPELGEADKDCRGLHTTWCEHHGNEYVGAILAGQKERDDINTGELSKWRDPPDAPTEPAG